MYNIKRTLRFLNKTTLTHAVRGCGGVIVMMVTSTGVASEGGWMVIWCDEMMVVLWCVRMRCGCRLGRGSRRVEESELVLQAELIEEERLARQKEEEANIALLESWDNTQAMMELTFNWLNKCKQKNKNKKPPTKAQKRNTMSTYLKNMAGYKHNQLKSKSYDEIQEMFDKEMKRVNTFVDMNTELVKGSKTKAEEVEKDYQEEADIKRHIEIVKDDEVAIDAIPLATKPPVIVDYKIDKDGRMGYFKLIRADGSSKRYSLMIKMLQGIDREDLETLWKLVKAKYNNTRPEDDYERVL
ncbi:hypothetical protein Tco_0602273 [Tanacetum coccineum]